MQALVRFRISVALAIIACTLTVQVVAAPAAADREPLFFFEDHHERCGYIDSQGRVAIEAQFEWAGQFVGPYAVVGIKDTGREHIIDRQGRTVVKVPEGASVDWFDTGAAILKRPDQKIELLDVATGKVTATDFDNLSRLAEGLSAFERGGRWGYADGKLNVVLPARFEHAMSFNEGRAGVVVGGRWGYIDRAGRMIVKPIYEAVTGFQEGLALVQLAGLGGRVFFIDREGKVQFEARQFESATLFSEGLAAVRETKKGSCGFIDKSGEYVIKPRFKRAHSFSEGLSAVWEGDRSGFIDRRGEYVIDLEDLETTSGFFNGLAFIRTEDGSQGYIDRIGDRKFWRPKRFRAR